MAPSERDAAGSIEEAFDSLVTAYHDALAAGETPAPFDDESLPPELAPRVRGATTCLDLLEEIRRSGRASTAGASTPALPWFSARPGEDPAAEVHIGRFRIERELGRGGHGVVFLAHDDALHRKVALKVPRPEV